MERTITLMKIKLFSYFQQISGQGKEFYTLYVSFVLWFEFRKGTGDELTLDSIFGQESSEVFHGVIKTVGFMQIFQFLHFISILYKYNISFYVTYFNSKTSIPIVYVPRD